MKGVYKEEFEGIKKLFKIGYFTTRFKHKNILKEYFMKVKDELYVQVYILAKQYLDMITPKEISQEELSRYFNISTSFESINDIMYQLLSSLQNNQMMSNVIGFHNPEKAPIFKELLFNYNPKLISDNYSSLYELFLEFDKNFKIRNKQSSKNLWLRYSKSILSACAFLSTFKDVTDFKNFVDSSLYNEFTTASLPMVLEKEIYGLGFPLACDFLKELGYSQYPKPDVHIKGVLVALELCKSDNFDAYKAVIKMAKINNDTPYNVDKVLWLICSGKFYLHGINIPKHKQNFITFVKNSLSKHPL